MKGKYDLRRHSFKRTGHLRSSLENNNNNYDVLRARYNLMHTSNGQKKKTRWRLFRLDKNVEAFLIAQEREGGGGGVLIILHAIVV